MNTNRPGSDVDLALIGQNIDDIVISISTKLNQETPLPYCFDVINYSSIDNPDLKSHVDRVGKPIYQSQKN